MTTDININARLQSSGSSSGVARTSSNTAAKAPPVSQAESQPVVEQKPVSAQSVSKNQRQELQQRQELAADKSVSQNQQESLEQTVTQLNDSIQSINRNIQFSVDDDIGRVIVKVVDKETDEVVRQIPSEEAVELVRRLREMKEQDKGDGALLEVKA